MKIHYLINIVIVLIFCQCESPDRKQNEARYDKIISIDVDNYKKENSRASILVDTVEYIALESPKNIIIGKIDKLKYIGDKFYIFDKLNNALFVFSDKGKFLHRIGNQGKGPEEYINLGSFAVDYNDKSIHLYDDHVFKILKYDSLGKYISCKQTEYLVSSFCVKNDLYGICTRFPNRDNFNEQVIFNRYVAPNTEQFQNNSLQGVYSSLLDRFSDSPNKFSEYGGHINFVDNYSSSIYQLGDSCNIEKQILIDFGKYKIQNIYDMTDQERSDYRRIFNKEQKASLFRINETYNWWIINYGFDNLFNLSFYSKQSKESFNIRGFWINEIDNISLPFPITTQGDYLISKMDAFTFKTMMENKNVVRPQHLIDLDIKLKPTDNPIIMKIKLKDDFDFKKTVNYEDN